MNNSKWYILADLRSNVAIDYCQLPDTWRDIPGMQTFSDDQLATIGEWSKWLGFSFLTLEAARAANIDQIDRVLTICKPQVLRWLRSMRDPLLAASDVATITDRWNNYDVVARRNVGAFRQKLRDITNGGVADVVWPVMPPELDFLKKIDMTGIARPAEGFKTMLQNVAVPLTLDQVRIDQADRIRDERERRKAGGLPMTVDGVEYWFWTDEASRTQYALLEGRGRRLGLTDSVVLTMWKTMSGAYVPLTVGLLHTIIDTGITNEMNIFQVAENHRQAMMQSADPAAYDYSSGWPRMYGSLAPLDNTQPMRSDDQAELLV